MNQFTERLYVRYNDNDGIIKFVCHEYVTVCIATYADRSRDVCILVYPYDWKKIHLIKESEK